MTTKSPSKALVASWWEYHRLSKGSRTERKTLESGDARDALDAYEAVNEIVELGGSTAVEWLAVLNEASPCGDNGLTVGCGPLEDLINDDADSVIDEIEDRTRLSPVFAQALSHVWPAWSEMSKETERRLAVLINRNK